jgi:hypothetical protein
VADSLTFDFDQVTPRMLIDFKAKTGVSLMGLMNEDGDLSVADLPEEAMAGLIWLSLRMSGAPDTTWDEALDTPFTRLEFADADGDVDPTSAGSDS